MRWRLVGALLLAVLVAVSGGTFSHLAEVSSRLEADLSEQADRLVSLLRAELEQTTALLDEEIGATADPRGVVSRSMASGRVEARFLGAQARLQQGRVEILKVLDAQGAILSSGHWPASFGALDPQVVAYKKEPGPTAHVLDEVTPSGSAPSLQRWQWGRWGAREVVVVAGRFLDGPSLERMRARIGADVLALCRSPSTATSARSGRGDGARAARRGVDEACVSARAPGLLEDVAFDPDDGRFRRRLVLDRIALAADRDEHAPVLIVGLDRAAIDRVRTGIVTRALAVGGASILFAMLLGVFLATRTLKPIEALAAASARLAAGDLGARVDPKTAGGGEVKDLVEAFNKMAADIERSQRDLRQAERVAAWREIARGLAHELKNPLTPILGAMDVLRKARKLGRSDFDEILDEQANAVVEEVMRLKELSDAFARFARLPDPKPEELDVAAVVDNTVALYGAGPALEVVRRYDPDVPRIVADRTQLATAAANLVKNAVEAMDGSGRLVLSLRKVGAQIELRVEDSGPGIAPEIMDRLFTPYVTTKGSRGTGLGLALVHRIVVEHGGTIEAGRSAEGGASFVLRLPIEAVLRPPPADEVVS